MLIPFLFAAFFFYILVDLFGGAPIMFIGAVIAAICFFNYMMEAGDRANMDRKIRHREQGKSICNCGVCNSPFI